MWPIPQFSADLVTLLNENIMENFIFYACNIWAKSAQNSFHLSTFIILRMHLPTAMPLVVIIPK